MKKIIVLILFVLCVFNSYSQNDKENSKPKTFKYPVLVKLIEGAGNVFRIGFIRHNDFFDIKEDTQDVASYYARFLSNTNLHNNIFVYFPSLNENGEMLILPKSSITKMDLTYEQAMQIILPD